MRGLAGVAAASIALSAAAAAADTPPAAPADPEVVHRATDLFTKGTQLYEAKRYDEALASLESSYRLVPSPNSGLIIARCLRELGKPAEAAAKFAEVERDANARVASGEARYGETAKTAADEGAAVRATLGTVHVHVAHLPAGGTVQIDGVTVPVTADAAESLHAAGPVTVTVRAPPASDRLERASVTAGQRVDVEIDAAPAPEPAPSTRPGWMVPAIAVAGSVGLLGIGVSIGAGVSSRATFNDLQASCGSRCFTQAEQDQISSGKRDQTIANVSLGVGIVGAAAAVAIGVVMWRRSSSARGPAPVAIEVGPGRATIEGRC
jgi:hypothetical protein